MKINFLKNLFTITTSLFLVYATSCSSEEDTDIENLNCPTLLAAAQINDYRIDYNYDTQNRLIRIIESDLSDISDIDSTDIAYDNEGRITQTIFSWHNGKNRDKSIDTYIYSGDSIFIKNDSETDIDTLIVVNSLLQEKREKTNVTSYSYDAIGNLIESEERNRNLTYNFKTTYAYDNLERGLLFDANLPFWFVVACDLFDINYSQSLCISNTYDNIQIENGIENELDNTIHYSIQYEYENEKPLKMIKKDIENNQTYEYTLEYVTN